jgi:hypothetical protein
MADVQDIDLLLDKYPPEQQTATSSVAAGMDANPAQAAQAYRLSAETGASPELIYHDVKGFQDYADDIKGRAAVESSAPLASWIAKNPFAAKVGRDELPALADLAAMVDGIPPGPPPLDLSDMAESLSRGWRHGEYQEKAGAYQFGFGDEAGLKAYEDELAQQPPGGFLDRLGQFLGTTVHSAAMASWLTSCSPRPARRTAASI